MYSSLLFECFFVKEENDAKRSIKIMTSSLITLLEHFGLDLILFDSFQIIKNWSLF